MTAVRVIGLAAVCLATTQAFALEQGEHRFNGFGTVGFTHLVAKMTAAATAFRGRPTIPGAATSCPSSARS